MKLNAEVVSSLILIILAIIIVILALTWISWMNERSTYSCKELKAMHFKDMPAGCI